MTTHINHIALVVEDIQAALGFWRDALGLTLAEIEQVPEQQATVAFLPVGASNIELVQPITDGSGIARYLAKRGPGLHHLCLEVQNLEQTLARLKAKGVRLIDEAPRLGSGGKKLAFIHPESTQG